MKIRAFITLFAVILAFFTACISDYDSNQTPPVMESLLLNMPESEYNLDQVESVALTCTHLNYKHTTPAEYSVQISLVENFDESSILPTLYSTTNLDINADEMALAITTLEVAAGKTDSDFPMTSKVYVRIHSNLGNGDESVTSNSILLDMRLSYTILPVKFPEKMYLIGDHCGWHWDNATNMVPVYADADGEYGGSFWYIEYFAAGNGIKIHNKTAWDGEQKGYNDVTLEDNASASLSDSGGNIAIGNAGWYLVVVQTEIVDEQVLYSVSFNEPRVYLFGPTNGGNWEALEENIFSVPVDKTGDFVSRAFLDAGEIRACVTIPNTDWWKSEFIVINEKLEFRGNGQDQDRVNGAVGERLYINFASRTGKIE